MQKPKTRISFLGGLITLVPAGIVWGIKIANSQIDGVLMVLSFVCGTGLALTVYGAISQPPARPDTFQNESHIGLLGLQMGFLAGLVALVAAIISIDFLKTVFLQVIAHVGIIIGVATAIYAKIREWRREY